MHIRSHNILRTSVNQYGQRYATLQNTDTERTENRSVGQLICEAFYGTPTDREATVLHRDGNQDNNAVDNLMWTTRWHAMEYHAEIRNPEYKKPRHVLEVKTGIIYDSLHAAAIATACMPSAIDYSRRYNDALDNDAHANFSHKTFPGGHIFKTP